MVFWQRAFNSGTGYMYLQSVAEYMQPEHKTSERSQAEISIQYLNLINQYVDTIFVLPNLGTKDCPLSQEIKTYSENLHKLTQIIDLLNVGKVRNNLVMSTFW